MNDYSNDNVEAINKLYSIAYGIAKKAIEDGEGFVYTVKRLFKDRMNEENTTFFFLGYFIMNAVVHIAVEKALKEDLPADLAVSRILYLVKTVAEGCMFCLTQEEKLIMREMRRLGFTTSEIAKITGRSLSTVKEALKS